MRREAAIARRRIGKPLGEDAIDADKLWKKTYGDPLHLLHRCSSATRSPRASAPSARKDTLGARLARGLAEELHRSAITPRRRACPDLRPDRHRPVSTAAA